LCCILCVFLSRRTSSFSPPGGKKVGNKREISRKNYFFYMNINMISTIQKFSHFESGSGAALPEKWRLDRLPKGLSCMFPSPREGRPRRCIPRQPSAPAGNSKNQAGEIFPPGHRDQEAKPQ
jgi:hypothetical protein